MNHYSRLTREQRYSLEAMKRNGASPKKIAGAIGKHPATVSREFRRAGMTSRSYRCVAGQEHAQSSEWKGRCIDLELWNLVELKIREQPWCPESIYQHIYRDNQAGGNLHRHFRHCCKSYPMRGSGNDRRGRLKDQVMIDPRPSVVESTP